MRLKIARWKHVNLKMHALGWLQGWGELADSLVTLLSFGFLMSNFEMQISWLRAKVGINEAKKRIQK